MECLNLYSNLYYRVLTQSVDFISVYKIYNSISTSLLVKSNNIIKSFIERSEYHHFFISPFDTRLKSKSKTDFRQILTRSVDK